MKCLESYSFENYSVTIIRMQEFPLTSRPSLLKFLFLGKGKKKGLQSFQAFWVYQNLFFLAQESPDSALH